MLLLPSVPPLKGESTVSWCSRLADVHAAMSCSDWLMMMQISRQSVVETSEDCVLRLSSLNGIAADRIRQCGVRSEGNRLFRYQAESFGMNFALRTHTTYCPACLLEDCDVSGSSAGHRVGRVVWSVAPVRSCPKHEVALVRRPNAGFYEQFQDMNLVAPGNGELDLQAKQAEQCQQSPLQSYVEQRFAGHVGPGWLDGQMIDQAARACEMLGVCRVFGAHTDLKKLTQRQWHEAGAAGFEAASIGPKGIYLALDEIAVQSWKVKRGGGPQAAYGRLYQWLQFPKRQRDPGPIRAVVREHILDAFEMEPGTTLFGTVVRKRVRHSVPSLARETGLHHKTLRYALIGAGLIPDDAETKTAVSFDAVAGEKLANRLTNSLPVTKIPGYLNCNRTQAEMLVRSGIISQLAPGRGKRAGLLSQVAIEDLDNFLDRFRNGGKAVGQASRGMKDVIETSEIARETATDIVRLVLERRLSRVEVLPAELGFRSVLVDPAEVKLLAEQKAAAIGYSAREVGRRLGIFASGVTWLRKTVDGDGRPLLAAEEAINARGTVRYRFAEAEVARFERAYASLTTLALEYGQSSKSMARRLREAGAEPIMRRELLNALIFRRADL